MKKKKAKKAGGAKKKDDKPEASGVSDAPGGGDDDDNKAEDAAAVPAAAAASGAAATDPPEATGSPAPVEDDDEPTELPASTAAHARHPSIAVESRQRSASFYRGAAGTPTSPTAVTPGGGGVSSDIYREQAQRIDELERENKRLAAEAEQSEARWKKGEEELEELREGRGDVALAAERGKEADKLVCRVGSEADGQSLRAS